MADKDRRTKIGGQSSALESAPWVDNPFLQEERNAEERNAKEADEYQQRRRANHLAAGSGSGLLRPRRTKNARLVWWLRFSRHHGVLRALGNARACRVSGYLHRILWRSGIDCRIAHPHRRSRNWRRDDRSDLHRSPTQRLLHELDGPSKG